MAFPGQDSQVIIAPVTAVVTVAKIVKIRQEALPATLFATGLAGVEKAVVNISPDGGDSLTPAAQSGTAVELTATNNTIAINSPMTIGITKTATAGAAGVFLNTGPRA
ncbi:MAG: hypothetical protein V3R41_03405 [Gammaproteobacteria bacterium]